MENKINVAELLKDCPVGMELDCVIYDNVTFEGISDNKDWPIKISVEGYPEVLNPYGCISYRDYTKCVIFPKGKTTWEGFVPPYKFKDGDILFVKSACSWILIYKESEDKGNIYKYAAILNHPEHQEVVNDNCPLCWKEYISETRFATEKEKQKLFDAIKENGYKWNAEKKELEKLIEPKFKVGEVIQDEDGYKVKITEVNIEDECYGYESMITKGVGGIAFSEQDGWELVPNKFNINTLKEFDKVLVRCNSLEKWHIQFFEKYNTESSEKYPFICLCNSKYCQCIPYNDETKHLLGTTNDCDDFYKTWK